MGLQTAPAGNLTPTGHAARPRRSIAVPPHRAIFRLPTGAFRPGRCHK